ncbi:hypothetical protein FLA_1984 [Filimonas lacunae]|nr:hypothetical protein FLA_1984 [Filimonas lacunae]
MELVASHVDDCHEVQVFSFNDAASGKNSVYDKEDATEVEDDDESISFRKYSEISNFTVSFIFTQVPGNFVCIHNNRLPFCKHFSYSSSSKYIVHRSIRV